jgi:DNA-binding transcriptional MerR regulator
MVAASALSTRQVATLSGATFRELQWWDEQSLLTASRNGHARAWGENTALAACVIKRWRRAGLPLQKLRPLARLMFKRYLEHVPPPYLLTDGVRLWDAQDEHEAVLILNRAMDPMVLVSLREMQARLARVKPIRKETSHERNA